MKRSFIQRLIPSIFWIRNYDRSTFRSDLVAGIVVTMMLIPQSLAYALLAGMPPQTGIYASILPLIAYALFGTSRTLSVGPVAITSLMTMVALSKVTQDGSIDYVTAAIALTALSGFFLLLMGLCNVGFVANFLSHTVVSGFITASGVIIALSQIRHIFGIEGSGDTLPELLSSLSENIDTFNSPTLLIGLLVLAFLFWARSGVVNLLCRLNIKKKGAVLLSKAAPVFGIITAIACVYAFNLHHQGVAIVGQIPSGLPKLAWPGLSWELFEKIWIPALSISIIGYVESVAVGKTLAAKRRQKIEPNQELIALGAANIASSVSGAFPVTGGLSRSVVNFDAGAVTQAASIYAAVGIGLASLFLAPVIYFLPKAALAATIIIAVLSLIDLPILKRIWRFSRSDFLAITATIIGTLFLGVEAGVGLGVAISIALHLYRTSNPHIAEVGLVDGSEHFRNVTRYHVISNPRVLCLRMDESLFFANASYLEDLINNRIYQCDEIAHVVLMCSAVNELDFTALESLENINQRLSQQGVMLHLSEVKGAVMKALGRSHFIEELSGNIYLTQFDAFQALNSTD